MLQPLDDDRPDPAAVSDTLREVLGSAALLQEVVPDAVLVGGAAAALYAGHRDSFDHDHVLTDLQDRYLQVLEAVEATDGWVTSVRASSPPLTILGSLGGIEAGLRQLRRNRPLETQEVELGPSGTVRVPTAAETLRVKAYLIVQRNQVRDYLDGSEAEAADREAVAAHVRELVAGSGLTAGRFAVRAGTSSSRLSTYATGKVVPSAAMMLRLERVARQRDHPQSPREA